MCTDVYNSDLHTVQYFVLRNSMLYVDTKLSQGVVVHQGAPHALVKDQPLNRVKAQILDQKIGPFFKFDP